MLLGWFSLAVAGLSSAATAQVTSGATYPPEALKQHHEGRVVVKLAIGTHGLVHGCTVTQSSGYAELDKATCDILQKRARFNPARDSAGNAVEDTYTQSVNWRLPDDQ
jgi:protein TonB